MRPRQEPAISRTGACQREFCLAMQLRFLNRNLLLTALVLRTTRLSTRSFLADR